MKPILWVSPNVGLCFMAQKPQKPNNGFHHLTWADWPGQSPVATFKFFDRNKSFCVCAWHSHLSKAPLAFPFTFDQPTFPPIFPIQLIPFLLHTTPRWRNKLLRIHYDQHGKWRFSLWSPRFSVSLLAGEKCVSGWGRKMVGAVAGGGGGVGGIKWPPRSRHVNRSPWFFTERFSRFSQRSHFWFYFRGHSLRWVDNKMSIKINTVDAARLYFWTKVRVVDLAAADEDALIMIIMRIMLQGFSCRRVTLVVRRLEVFSTRP